MSPKSNTLSRTHFPNAYWAAPIAKISPCYALTKINSYVYGFFSIVIYASLTSTECNLFTLVDYEIVIRFVNQPI